MVTEGSLFVADAAGQSPLRVGQPTFVSGNEEDYKLIGTGIAFRASVGRCLT